MSFTHKKIRDRKSFAFVNPVHQFWNIDGDPGIFQNATIWTMPKINRGIIETTEEDWIKSVRIKYNIPDEFEMVETKCTFTVTLD